MYLGEIGQLSPQLAKRYDLRDPVLLAELNFDALLARRNTSKSFKPLPQLPGIRRDIAMVVPESTTHEAVLNVIRQTKPQYLENVSGKFGKLIEKQHAVVGHADFAGSRDRDSLGALSPDCPPP